VEFYSDANYMMRWYAYPEAALAAEIEGKLVGSNFLSLWGSVGTFGPLSVHPDFMGQRWNLWPFISASRLLGSRSREETDGSDNGMLPKLAN